MAEREKERRLAGIPFSCLPNAIKHRPLYEMTELDKYLNESEQFLCSATVCK